jgi:hypothetical protein
LVVVGGCSAVTGVEANVDLGVELSVSPSTEGSVVVVPSAQPPPGKEIDDEHSVVHTSLIVSP